MYVESLLNYVKNKEGTWSLVSTEHPMETLVCGRGFLCSAIPPVVWESLSLTVGGTSIAVVQAKVRGA